MHKVVLLKTSLSYLLPLLESISFILNGAGAVILAVTTSSFLNGNCYWQPPASHQLHLLLMFWITFCWITQSVTHLHIASMIS